MPFGIPATTGEFVKIAATGKINESIDRAIAAANAGDNIGAAQGYFQALAVSAAYSVGILWGFSTYPVAGLSQALRNLANSPGTYESILANLLPRMGLATDPLVINRLSTIGKPFAGGAAAAYMTNELIDFLNSLNIGGILYDWSHVDPLSNTNWSTATTPPRRDPLAIDLDGDGIETVGIPTGGNPILFDHDADGVKTGTGWLKGDDAWLVLDRDGNGSIDSGRELFGVDTLITVTERISGTFDFHTVTRNARNGFEALRSLDTGNGIVGSAGYGDGIFNANDAAFTQVKLWQDLNQDGISQSTELFSLADKSIVSIDLNATANTFDLGNGNTITGQATVTRVGGGVAQIAGVDLQAGNLNLADNPFYRQFPNAIPLTVAAKALPEMGGSGWLRDMREAMSLGTAQAGLFAQSVAGFAAATTRDAQQAQLDALIDGWAQTTGRVDTGNFVRPISRTVLADNGSTQTVRYTTMDPGNYPDPAGGATPGAELRLPANFYETVVQAGVSVQVLTAEGREVLRRLGELEAFNGGRFINFTTTEAVGGGGDGGAGGGGGGGAGGVGPRGWQTTFVVALATSQVSALNAAYDALRESVYQSLVMQTRLRPYLDSIDLVIDDTGIRFDSTALGAKLATFKAVDERNAVLDLVDLTRYAEPTLLAVGCDNLAVLQGWVGALPANSPLRAELGIVSKLLLQV